MKYKNRRPDSKYSNRKLLLKNLLMFVWYFTVKSKSEVNSDATCGKGWVKALNQLSLCVPKLIKGETCQSDRIESRIHNFGVASDVLQCSRCSQIDLLAK